jgi:tetratricopeptide (TPR) repeat protein
MRPDSLPRLLAPALLVFALAGCGTREPAPVPSADKGPVAPGAAKPAPSVEAPRDLAVTPVGDAGTRGDSLVKLLDLATDRAPQPSKGEQYDAALLEALGKMADRNYADALAALDRARAAQDTEQVRFEIEKVKRLIDEQKAAEQTQKDVQAVLDDGKADEAAKLAAAGLQQYGGGDAAAPLAQLKREADALSAAALDDAAARRARFAREGDDALRDRNLRAAVIAYEQALQAGDDPTLRARLDDTRASVARYDEARRRAQDLRRDPANLELALAALQEAAKAWDTPQVHEEIDDCTLALQKRRDRISVADFEVRGDVGIPTAGRTIAENLLPGFKPRFDLVEREQIGKVLDELRLESSDVAASAEARQQVGQLARVRYLVVGSVTPLCGLTVNARLVEVQTGLVVQTAKLIATDPDDLMRRLPKLALLLQMTDEQKIAFEAELAQAPAAVVQPAVVAPLPPAPPMPDPAVVIVAPPPILVYTPRPAPVGGLVIADFDRAPPAEPSGFSFDLFVAKDNPVKDRMLSVSVELGDNLFRRGRYREAQHHFELALSLSKGHADIAVRLDRCRQLAPPPPVVVAPPPVVVVVRPRFAVFNFVVDAPPGLVPAGSDNWAADQLAGCFATQYEVIDRGEVCWWMGRLGLTMRDVLTDPASRIALAQSLNARFFIFGGIQHTASFNVTAHVIDAQTGVKSGSGAIHVQDQAEMKLRMGELVAQASGTPAQARQLAQAGRESEQVVNDARKLLQAGKYAEASATARAGLQKYPNNVALQSLQAQADQQAEKARLEAARRQEAARQVTLAEAARKQQQELAKQGEAARLRAQQEAKASDEAAKRAREAQKQRAFDNLLGQARSAAKAGNSQQAVSLYDSALALKSDPGAARERDQVKASAAQTAKAKADDEKAWHEAEAAKQREAALAAARAKVEADKKQRDAEAAAKQKALEDQARADAEKKRAAEQAARDAAAATEAEKKKRLGEYTMAMQAGRDALKARRFDDAVRSFGDALKVMPGDRDATASAQQAIKARDDAKTAADAEKKLAAEKAAHDAATAKAQQQAEADKAKRQADYAKAIQAGRDAWAARRFDDAAKAFGDALKIMPGDATATAYEKQAIKARDDAKAAADAEAKRKADYTRLMNQAQTAMGAKHYDDALKDYGEALKLQPGDAAATKGHRDAQAALDAAKVSPKPAPPPPPPPAEYTKQMNAAAALEKQQKYADALTAYKAALKVVPNDAAATKAADFAQHMADGQKALAARKFPDAVRELEAALKVKPNDADATALLKRAKDGRP